MSAQNSRWTDHQVEQMVGRLLQLGVMVAATVTIIGGILYLIQQGSTIPDYRVFVGGSEFVTSLGGIARGIAQMRSESIVQLGLVLLIATPVARVACTLVAFILQRDRVYIVLTTVVLALLLYGLIFGKT